jgi:hypothetical protein
MSHDPMGLHGLVQRELYLLHANLTAQRQITNLPRVKKNRQNINKIQKQGNLYDNNNLIKTGQSYN